MGKNVYDLTNPQKSIFWSEQFTNTPINNIVGTMFFEEDIDLDLLKEAVFLTVKNNQAMRMILVKPSTKQNVESVNSTVTLPKQTFEDFSPFPISFHDFSDKTMEDFRDFQKKFSQELFDLYDGFLFQFTLCKICNHKFALIGKFHHLITDAWSLGLIIDQIAMNYTSLASNEPISQNTGLYSDFIKREQDYMTSTVCQKNKDFWLHTLADFQPARLKNDSCDSYEARKANFLFF